ILFHDHVGDFVNPLVARESLAALQTFAAAPDDVAFLGLPRIDDFVAEVRAIRALHSCELSSARRRMPATFSPSWAAKRRPSKSDGPTENKWSTIAAPTAASSDAPKNVVAP